MRLPTLNVDVKVNTSTMKKDIERANKELTNIGGKGAAFVGGGIGKIGSLGSLGGSAGAAFTGIAGIGAAIAAPIKIASEVMDTLASSAREAEQTLKEFAKTGTTSGMTALQATQIAAGAQPAQGSPGIFGAMGRAFSSTSALQEGGQSVLGKWAEDTWKGAQWIGGFIGAAAANIGGNLEIDEVMRQADLSIAGSEQEARTLFSRDELKQLDMQMYRFQKQMRETTT